MISDNTPIKPFQPTEIKLPTLGTPTQKEGSVPKLTDEIDPWYEMFRPLGATPVDIEKFKSGVFQTLNAQIAHDRKKATEALRRMREEI